MEGREGREGAPLTRTHRPSHLSNCLPSSAPGFSHEASAARQMDLTDGRIDREALFCRELRLTRARVDQFVIFILAITH